MNAYSKILSVDVRAHISMPSFTAPPEAKLAHDQQQAHLRILKWQQLVSDLQLEKVSGAATRCEPRRGPHDWLRGVRHQVMVRVKGSAAKSFRFFGALLGRGNSSESSDRHGTWRSNTPGSVPLRCSRTLQVAAGMGTQRVGRIIVGRHHGVPTA